MKKLLLSFAAALLAVSSFGQTCTPGAAYPAANFADSSYGAWPDTIVNFPPAETGVYYEEVLNFLAPAAVTAELDPSGQYVGSPIQSYSVTDVVGLPTGFTYQCNNSNCDYVGGELGCATVSGTTANAGTYPVEIFVDVIVLVDLPIIGPTPVPQSTSFTGYKIIVGTTGIISFEKDKFSVFPNPANNEVTINGLEDLNVSSLEIVNMAGATIKAYDNVNTPSFNMNIADLENGMYFIKINHDITELVKFIKK